MADYMEMVLSDQPDEQLLRQLANRLMLEFKAELVGRVGDVAAQYWDFVIQDEQITRHAQFYPGISIFPRALENASTRAHALVEEIGRQLQPR